MKCKLIDRLDSINIPATLCFIGLAVGMFIVSLFKRK